MDTDQPELDLSDPVGAAAGEGFGGPKVCDIVGISYRQLDYWARTDLIRPSIADAAGSGTQRRYSYRDLVELKVVKSLLDAGVSLQSARKAVAYFREHVERDLATASLVIDGKNSVVTRSGDDLLDLVRQGQGVLNIVPIGSMVDELDAQIVELVPGPSADHRASPRPDDGVTPSRAAGAED
ncbi:MAG: MerR family transcriptional regulator [Acidimicrobiia bacterium]